MTLKADRSARPEGCISPTRGGCCAHSIAGCRKQRHAGVPPQRTQTQLPHPAGTHVFTVYFQPNFDFKRKASRRITRHTSREQPCHGMTRSRALPRWRHPRLSAREIRGAVPKITPLKKNQPSIKPGTIPLPPLLPRCTHGGWECRIGTVVWVYPHLICRPGVCRHVWWGCLYCEHHTKLIN